MAARTERVHVRLTPAEYAALEAARALWRESQADAIARLCRLECAAHMDRPACEEALLLLDAERGEPASKAGRPATAPKVARAAAARVPADPVRVGARFEHRDWRVGGRDDGAPLCCEVVAVTADEVRFRRQRLDGRGMAAKVEGCPRESFERRCVGRWAET